MARNLGQLTVDLAMRTGSFISDTGRAAKVADKRAKEIEASFRAAGKVAGLALAAGITTASVAIKSAINAMDAMSKAAQRANMPTEEFSRLAYAASLADVSIQDLQGAFGKLAKAQGDAQRATSVQGKLFDALGISVKNVDGSMRSTGVVFSDFADRFKQLKGSPEIMAAGMNLFGRSFQNLIPLLKDGADGLRAAGVEADNLGKTLSTKAGRDAEAFNDNLTRMQTAVSSLAQGVAAELLPDMLSLSGGLLGAATNGDRMSEAIDGITGSVRELIEFGKELGKVFDFLADVRMGLAGLEKQGAGLTFGLVKLAAGDIAGAKEALAYYKQGTEELDRAAGKFSNKNTTGIASPGYAQFPSALTGAPQAAFSAISFNATAGVQPGSILAEAAAIKEARARQEAISAALGDTAKKPKKDNTASKAAADAARDYAKSLEEAARAATELTGAQDQANQTLEDWRAELAGPSATAILKYTRMERELDLDMAAGILTFEQYAEALGLVAQMREKDVDLMSDQAKAAEAMAEDQKRTAEEYQYNWEGAISSVAGAMGDFFADGLRDGKSFVDELKNIFKRWLSNVIAIFSDGALKRAFGSVAQSVSGWMSSMGGSGGNSGGIVNTAMKFFTGGSGGNGGFSMAGVSGSTGSTWTSMITTAASSWLGLGGSATGAGAMATFGSEIGAFSTAGGTSALGAGGAASGAAAMATAIPIIGAIIVGMMMNDAAFKEGFKLDGQKNDMSEYYAKKGMFAVTIATATVGAADTLLRSIGLSDRWASLISGSSLHAKIWGMGTPKVNASGIQGSVGFGGIEGESFADIKQKGGWFRSDKNWTETGALSAGIDRAFDMASARVGSGAMDLAKQLGIDVTGALGAVRIDIGKLVLDADPEKAREQIEAKITEVMESLSTAAIKALGFNRLLDDGFASSDIMSTLAVSIALVTGGAEKLGRALSDLEKENVARATEYFEGLAIKNGTGLGDEVQRTVGLLGEYSSLITGVDTELQTRDLNQYQSAQLQIELQYRNQIKSANQLAKALGLTGARAEDLAKIEQLRAVNMASLQTAMEAQKNTFLDDLGLSDLSTLRDDQKLTESMQLLRDAVGSGDLQRAQQLSQQALGFGRNLYASGNDYSGLYGEVTGLLDSIAPAGMDGFDAAGLDTIADLLTGLPDGIASAMFNLLYGPAVADTSVLPPPPIAPPPPNGLTPGRPGGRDLTPGDGTYHVLQQILAKLDGLETIAANTGGSLQQQRSDSLATMNR